MSLVFALLSNGVKYSTVIGTAKDVQKEYVDVDNAFYPAKITKKQIGIMVKAGKVIYFKDLFLNTEKEVKSIPPRMLVSLINKDFSNTNTTFFMLERGLVNEDRSSLSDKGQELYDLAFKDKK